MLGHTFLPQYRSGRSNLMVVPVRPAALQEVLFCRLPLFLFKLSTWLLVWGFSFLLIVQGIPSKSKLMDGVIVTS